MSATSGSDAGSVPAVLIARSNRLGADPANTNYAGGNTSAKGSGIDPVTGEPVDLLETLATRLAEVCLQDGRVTGAEVTVHKPAAPIPFTLDDVSVTVLRP